MKYFLALVFLMNTVISIAGNTFNGFSVWNNSSNSSIATLANGGHDDTLYQLRTAVTTVGSIKNNKCKWGKWKNEEINIYLDVKEGYLAVGSKNPKAYHFNKELAHYYDENHNYVSEVSATELNGTNVHITIRFMVEDYIELYIYYSNICFGYKAIVWN